MKWYEFKEAVDQLSKNIDRIIADSASLEEVNFAVRFICVNQYRWDSLCIDYYAIPTCDRRGRFDGLMIVGVYDYDGEAWNINVFKHFFTDSQMASLEMLEYQGGSRGELPL